MPEAVIIDAARTPMGRYGGILKDIRPDDLAAHVIATLVARNQLDKGAIEDVILGCTNQATSAETPPYWPVFRTRCQAPP